MMNKLRNHNLSMVLSRGLDVAAACTWVNVVIVYYAINHTAGFALSFMAVLFAFAARGLDLIRTEPEPPRPHLKQRSVTR